MINGPLGFCRKPKLTVSDILMILPPEGFRFLCSLVLLFIYLLYFRPIILFDVTSRFCVDEWKKIESFSFHSAHRRISSFDYPSCGKVSLVANESRFFLCEMGLLCYVIAIFPVIWCMKKKNTIVLFCKEFDSTIVNRWVICKVISVVLFFFFLINIINFVLYGLVFIKK